MFQIACFFACLVVVAAVEDSSALVQLVTKRDEVDRNGEDSTPEGVIKSLRGVELPLDLKQMAKESFSNTSRRMLIRGLADPQAFIQEFEQVAIQNGLMKRAIDAARKLSNTASSAKGGAYDTFFVGIQIHVGAPYLLGPGGDLAIFFPVCTKETCPGAGNETSAKKDDAKACMQLMGGIEPLLTPGDIKLDKVKPEHVFEGADIIQGTQLYEKVWDVFRPDIVAGKKVPFYQYWAPHDWVIDPMILAGFGNFKYTTGLLAEFGVNLEAGDMRKTNAVPFVMGAYASELSLTAMNEGPHLHIFEFGSPKINLGLKIREEYGTKAYTAPHGSPFEALFISAFGKAWCTPPRGSS